MEAGLSSMGIGQCGCNVRAERAEFKISALKATVLLWTIREFMLYWNYSRIKDLNYISIPAVSSAAIFTAKGAVLGAHAP